MSKKLSPTRGLHRVQAKHRLLGLATKITGRNLAAVSYITSLEAERRGVEIELRTKFAADGSLVRIEVIDADEAHGIHLKPGHFLVLEPGLGEACVLTADEYNQYFRRVVE